MLKISRQQIAAYVSVRISGGSSPAHLDASICTDRAGLGWVHWFGSYSLWYALNATDEGHTNLQKNGNLRAVRLLLGHTKMDSTVRYLGVELEDALAISEAIEI